ncbi:MAG: aldehyde dehydrogenase family protein [Deltaproteobacteria bacterium]|nr:aldehyde dehydrogenase family protein [Deltaproteobacteria bacterium]
MSNTNHPLFLSGKFTHATNHHPVCAPWDGQTLGVVAQATDEQIEQAIATAHSAVRHGRAIATHTKREWLTQIASEIAAHRDEMANTLALEAGKPIRFALAEVDRSIQTFRLGAEECARLGGEVMALDMSAATEGAVGGWTRVSPGALLAITPFNFPLNLVAHKLAPALALGMPTVLKPAPQTPLTALALAAIYQRVGVCESLLSVLPMDHVQAARMVDDDRFAAISFTGSASVGWDIQSRASRRRTVLELGGNASAIVAPDADALAVVDKLVTAAFAYAGQVCIKTQHVYVCRSQYQAFLDAVVARTAEIQVCDPMDPAGLCGPVIDAKSAERIARWIAEARARGAVVHHEPNNEGNRVGPTVISLAVEGTSLFDEEVFGPVLLVHAYDSLEEVIAQIERGKFGLQCALFTHDIRTIRSIFSRISVGALIVNDASTFRVDAMPYGGIKESGRGREGVRFAVDELADKKLLVLR